MRVTEALILQNKIKKQGKQNTGNEEDETTLRYMERKQDIWRMNQSKSVFTSPFSDGINSASSVFDKHAVFKTGNR